MALRIAGRNPRSAILSGYRNYGNYLFDTPIKTIDRVAGLCTYSVLKKCHPAGGHGDLPIGYRHVGGVMKNQIAYLGTTLLGAALCACAPVDTVRTSAPPTAVNAAVTTSSAQPIHWFRDSSEYQASARTVYGAAKARIVDHADIFPDRCDHPAGPSWAVVMDADETLLDNSLYQAESLIRGAQYDANDWNAWVGRGEEQVVPGSVDFVAAVAERCGTIVVVTNRAEKMNTKLVVDECAATVSRLAQLFPVSRGVYPIKAVVCRATSPDGKSDGDKNGRFDRVRAGLPNLGPLDVKMYLGDSITDFPGFHACNSASDLIAAAPKFGIEYFALPNPMYGRWTTCPARHL
jgi:acid phosphatase